MNYLTLARGVESDFPSEQKIFGANVALEQYATDEALQHALQVLKAVGLTHARQYFPWREIEARRGIYDWTQWDRIVNAAHSTEIQLVAVLYTAPAWSQRESERLMPGAPPDDFAEYARFVEDFAKRYGDMIEYYEIWDEPNVEPHWGKRNADPVEYAQMLIPASQAIRANAPNAKILLAGLAMNLELHRPHPNYSEVLFLRGLYEIGANRYFDIVAAKPYGMWTGPEDRTVNSGVLNLSRLILVRDEMRQYGDHAKPVWAVEMGWNALPANWQGQPSPWGTDSEAQQADRLARALTRMEFEWDWVTGIFPQHLQPDVPLDDPRWGFSLSSPDGAPRAFVDAIKSATQHAAGASVRPPDAPVLPIVLLLGVALVSAWRAWAGITALHLEKSWRALKARVQLLPQLAQWLVLVAAVAAFYLSPSTPVNFILLAVLIFLFALRLDVGIALTIFVIPFWNYPKTLFGGFQLSPVEVLTWISTASFTLNFILSRAKNPNPENVILSAAKNTNPENVILSGAKKLNPSTVILSAAKNLSLLSPLDWAVLAFFLLALVSTRSAGNFGVASREFRIIVLDPILLYTLIRFSAFSLRQLRWFVNALFASGVVVCAIGLYQYLTGDVILADGIGRLTAVWGSPNNVGLYLGRLLPIALAFVLVLRDRGGDSIGTLHPVEVRWIYAALAALFGVTILLTYSRGALFLGVPAGTSFVLLVLYLQSHHFSRRARLALGGAIVLTGIALLPFLTSERLGSLFQPGTGTGFFRVAVWTSAVHMIRDHPLLGVGLDNFLYEYPKYILPEAWREPNLSHPHNIILDFWVRLGIGGVLVLLWLLIAFFKQAWSVFKQSRDDYTRALMLGLMASVVNMLAHGLIDAAYFVVDLAYVFLLTLALVQVSRAVARSIEG